MEPVSLGVMRTAAATTTAVVYSHAARETLLMTPRLSACRESRALVGPPGARDRPAGNSMCARPVAAT